MYSLRYYSEVFIRDSTIQWTPQTSNPWEAEKSLNYWNNRFSRCSHHEVKWSICKSLNSRYTEPSYAEFDAFLYQYFPVSVMKYFSWRVSVLRTCAVSLSRSAAPCCFYTTVTWCTVVWRHTPSNSSRPMPLNLPTYSTPCTGEPTNHEFRTISWPFEGTAAIFSA